VRDAEEYAAGHVAGFRHYPGGQLVQEIDMAAPVRGARILLTDNMGVRADMTASWLAQMGWEVYVLDGGYDRALEMGPPKIWPKPDPAHRYRRPYEGTDVARRHAWVLCDLISTGAGIVAAPHVASWFSRRCEASYGDARRTAQALPGRRAPHHEGSRTSS
jgi:rhodanese-related sulfurtransferase